MNKKLESNASMSISERLDALGKQLRPLVQPYVQAYLQLAQSAPEHSQATSQQSARTDAVQAAPAATPVVRLVCDVETRSGGRGPTLTYTLDFNTQSVNGRAMQHATDASVQLQYSDSAVVVLDRYSGVGQIVKTTDGDLTRIGTMRCSPVTQRRF